MAGICEAGHRSASDDYCDICGMPVTPVDSPPAPSAAPAGSSQKCPNCGAANPLDALFCEACGYDYTTGTLPRSDLAGMLGLVGSNSQSAGSPLSGTGEAGGPGEGPAAGADRWIRTKEEPVPETPPNPSADEPAATPAPAVDDPPQLEEPVVAVPEATATSTEPQPVSELVDADEPATKGRPAPRRESYVAELWIDPDWYDVQSSPDAMPSVGLPDTVKLGDTNLIGRASRSRNIAPEIDCGVDTGCSRRQAMLTTDGTRWYVEDLSSANGTYVGPAGGPLPTEPISGRTELATDDRIYVGAWTRIVVRKASREEIEALS